MTVLRQRGRKKEKPTSRPPDGWLTWVACYMVSGNKSGREYSRDELDERVILDGSLRVFDQVLADSGDTDGETHRHFTLGWKEDYLPPEIVHAIYQDLKTFLLAAYDENEVFMYGEAHHPRIKSYVNKNGKKVDRYGHMHAFLASRNAKTGAYDVNPFGYFPLRVEYAHAFQKYIDMKFGLASPGDNRRVTFTDESTVIEDHNGNPFHVDTNKVVKEALLAEVLDTGIASQDEFIELLRSKCASATDVKFGNRGKVDQYIKYRPRGSSKFIRLKQVFSQTFLDLPVAEKRAKVEEIFRKKYHEPGPEKLAPEEVNQRLNDWFTFGALEVRYLTMRNKDALNAYYALSSEEKRTFLLQRREEQIERQLKKRRRHEQVIRKHEKRDPDVARNGRHADASTDEPGAPKSGSRGPSQFGPRLPPLPVRPVAKGRARRPERTVPSDARADLASRPQQRDAGRLRWNLSRQEERQRELKETTATGRVEDSVAGQLLRDVKQAQLLACEETQPDMDRIKHELDPMRLLNALSSPPYSITVDQYAVGQAKDGSPRIKCGARHLTMSDFLTKEMHLPWPRARDVMQDVFERQLKGEPGAAVHAQPEVLTWQAFQKAKRTLVKADREKVSHIEAEAATAIKALREQYRNAIKAERGNKSVRPVEYKETVALLQMQLTMALWEAEELVQRNLSELKRLHAMRDFDRYRQYLHALATAGDTEALLQLQRHRATELDRGSGYGCFVGTGKLTASARLPKQADFDYEVDADGGVTYFDKKSHKPLLRDEGLRVAVLDQEMSSVEVALRLAMEKFGTRLEASGSLEFKEQLCRLAVERGFDVTFTDPRMMVLIAQLRQGRAEDESAPGFGGVTVRYATPSTERTLRERYGLHERMQPDGTTAYHDEAGTRVLHDSALKVAVLRQQRDDIEAALLLAREKFGREMTVKGDAAFREKVAQAVATNGIDVSLDDDVLNARTALLRQVHARAKLETNPVARKKRAKQINQFKEESTPPVPVLQSNAPVLDPEPKPEKKRLYPDPWDAPKPKPPQRRRHNPDW